MNSKIKIIVSLIMTVLLLGAATTVLAQEGTNEELSPEAFGTAFAYQGELSNAGGNPLTATCDFRFGLWNAASGPTQVGGLDTNTAVSVTNGRFTTLVNDGNEFGSSAFTGSARYLEIEVRCGSETVYTKFNQRQLLSLTPQAAYALKAPWGGLSGVPAGFADGTDNDTNTTYTAGSGLALTGVQFSLSASYRLPQTCSYRQTPQWDTASSTWGCGNDLTGSDWHLTGNSGTNPATNFIGTTDNQALVFKVNGQQALRLEPTTISPNVIGGYYGNSVTAGMYGATIGGGGAVDYNNQVTGNFGTIAGGLDNEAGPTAFVGGGGINRATGSESAVLGGWLNIASGKFAVVAGGTQNTAAGANSFVAGTNAKNTNTSHSGVFLFADNSTGDFNSAAANEFAVRAAGGVRFKTNAALSTGCSLAAGSGTWSCTSDRNAKANFEAVDSRAILAQVAALPISTWNYNTQNASIQHIGPMSQDFYAAFAVGDDDKSISMVDADGVALAAIQGLNQIVEEKDAEIASLEARIAALEKGSPVAAAGPLATPWPWLTLGAVTLGGMAFFAHEFAARKERKG